MNNIKPVAVVIIAVVMGAAGFFGGVQYQLSKLPKNPQGFRGMGQGINVGPGGAGQRVNGQGGAGNQGVAGGQGMGFRPVVGDILSQDATSITLKLVDGSSKIILISSTTPVAKTAEGSLSDLKVGDKIGVFGTTNPDGSVSAQSLQLNPTFGMPEAAKNTTQNR
jgi:hypothetical protein